MPEIALNPPPFNPVWEKGAGGMRSNAEHRIQNPENRTLVRVRGDDQPKTGVDDRVVPDPRPAANICATTPPSSTTPRYVPLVRCKVFFPPRTPCRVLPIPAGGHFPHIPRHVQRVAGCRACQTTADRQGTFFRQIPVKIGVRLNLGASCRHVSTVHRSAG